MSFFLDRVIQLITILISCFLAWCSPVVFAQSRSNTLTLDQDPRGQAELVVCSQNLENYGDYATVRTRIPNTNLESYKIKQQALVKRFIKAGCDVIAVQELLGKDEEQAKIALDQLGLELRKSSGRIFESHVGPSSEKTLHVGFLVALDRATVLNRLSYSNVELPKFLKKEKPRFFSRGPLEIQLEVKPQGQGFKKTVALINFHLKSKSGGSSDPVSLDWETLRMQMAEGLRRIAENRYATSFSTGETILILLGDRNSNFDQASAKILEGVLDLKQFANNGTCRLSKRGVPLCQAGSAHPQRLFSVLTLDPQTRQLPGTLKYKGVYSWLDDIIMPLESMHFASTQYDGSGDYNSGVIYLPAEASDHALVYTVLNW